MARTVPAPAIQQAGSVVPSAAWNSGPKALNSFYMGVPIFRGRQTIAQSVATNTYVAISLNASDVDSDSGHSNSTNNSRYTCQVAGWYYVEGFAAFANNTGAQSTMRAFLAVNSTGGLPNVVSDLLQVNVKPANDYASLSGSGILRLAVGDYVEVWCLQASGSTLNTAPLTDISPSMNLFWMHS